MKRDKTNSIWLLFGFIVTAIIMLLFNTGCATHTIEISNTICKDGVLKAYQDEEFAMECQSIDRHVFAGESVPSTYVKQVVPTTPIVSGKPVSFYGKDLVSVSK